MLLFQELYINVFTIICSVYAKVSGSCQSAMKNFFDQLQESYVSTGQYSNANIPKECAALKNVFDEPIASYKVSWNAYCESEANMFNLSMTSYFYIKHLDLIAAENAAVVAAAQLTEILLNTSCTSGLMFVSDGTEQCGWNVWYEVTNPSGMNCNVQDDVGALADSISDNFASIARWSKSSSCTVIKLPADETSNIKIILHSLHNQESMFESVAEVQCYYTKPSD